MSGLKLRIYIIIVRLNLFFTDGVICGNEKAQNVVTQLQTTNYKLPTIICPISGVDTEKFRPNIISDWRNRLGIKSQEKLILFYGALDARKGLEVLINAFHMLNAKYLIPDTKLLIVGTGPKLDKLKLQVISYKLQDRVIFLDWMPNDQLPVLLNTADVFVYPSVPAGGWEEQFGYAMAEANACGVPVVSTRTGSIDEVIADSQSGMLVEPNNPEQLADALVGLLSDNDLRKQMGIFGRGHVVKNFSHQAVAEKIENFLNEFTI